jgi:hypothetical protein
MYAAQIVDALLDQNGNGCLLLGEASVYLPPRSTKWVAVFTGIEAGKQIRRTTGLTNRRRALALALKWERQARAARSRGEGGSKKPSIRAGASEDSGLLTQKEVAAVLGMSERGVREAERRAFSKLRTHPALRKMWKDYVGR